MLRGSAREIVLVDRIAGRAAAVATDMRYGVPLSPTAAIASGERAVLPVAAYRERHGVTIALPTVVGREGAAGELEPSMSEDERRAFERRAGTLREAARAIGMSPAPI